MVFFAKVNTSEIFYAKMAVNDEKWPTWWELCFPHEKVPFYGFCLKGIVFTLLSRADRMRMSITWRPTAIQQPCDWQNSHHFFKAKGRTIWFSREGMKVSGETSFVLFFTFCSSDGWRVFFFFPELPFRHLISSRVDVFLCCLSCCNCSFLFCFVFCFVFLLKLVNVEKMAPDL